MKRVFPSIKSAAAALGVSVNILRAAKQNGCPCFRGSRVSVEGLTDWLVDNPDALAPASLAEEATTWRIRRLKAQCRKLDHEYETAMAELVPASAVNGSITLAEPVMLRVFASFPPVTRSAISASLTQAFQTLRHELHAKRPARIPNPAATNTTGRLARMVAGQEGDSDDY